MIKWSWHAFSNCAVYFWGDPSSFSLPATSFDFRSTSTYLGCLRPYNLSAFCRFHFKNSVAFGFLDLLLWNPINSCAAKICAHILVGLQEHFTIGKRRTNRGSVIAWIAKGLPWSIEFNSISFNECNCSLITKLQNCLVIRKLNFFRCCWLWVLALNVKHKKR